MSIRATRELSIEPHEIDRVGNRDSKCQPHRRMCGQIRSKVVYLDRARRTPREWDGGDI